MIRPLLLATLLCACVLCGCHKDAIVRCRDTGTYYDAPYGKRTKIILPGQQDTLITTFEDGRLKFDLPVSKCSVEYVR